MGMVMNSQYGSRPPRAAGKGGKGYIRNREDRGGAGDPLSQDNMTQSFSQAFSQGSSSQQMSQSGLSQGMGSQLSQGFSQGFSQGMGFSQDVDPTCEYCGSGQPATDDHVKWHCSFFSQNP